MATAKRDYYEVLGVDRNATPDEVKKAFRRLARQYHPDHNNADGAEARFKELGEAYEVISDLEKRSAYDRYGHAGLQGFDPGRGFDGADVSLARDEISEMNPSSTSLMPEGLLDGLTDQQLRDIFAYLRIPQPISK